MCNMLRCIPFCLRIHESKEVSSVSEIQFLFDTSTQTLTVFAENYTPPICFVFCSCVCVRARVCISVFLLFRPLLACFSRLVGKDGYSRGICELFHGTLGGVSTAENNEVYRVPGVLDAENIWSVREYLGYEFSEKEMSSSPWCCSVEY